MLHSSQENAIENNFEISPNNMCNITSWNLNIIRIIADSPNAFYFFTFYGDVFLSKKSIVNIK